MNLTNAKPVKRAVFRLTLDVVFLSSDNQPLDLNALEANMLHIATHAASEGLMTEGIPNAMVEYYDSTVKTI